MRTWQKRRRKGGSGPIIREKCRSIIVLKTHKSRSMKGLSIASKRGGGPRGGARQSKEKELVNTSDNRDRHTLGHRGVEKIGIKLKRKRKRKSKKPKI